MICYRHIFVVVMAACAGAASAAETPWGDGYPAFLPDTNALHGRLHDHSQDNLNPSADESAERVRPEVLETVEPTYPHDAMEDCRSGWVLLEMIVGKDGVPRDIEVVAQDYQGVFEKSAKIAMAKWRFKPATINGEPVDWRVTMPFRFRRPICGFHHIPQLHEGSLNSEIKLPVTAAGGIEKAEIVMMPMRQDLFGAAEGVYVHAQKWVKGDVIPLDPVDMNSDLIVHWPKGDNSPLDISPARARIARIVPFVLTGEPAKFSDAAGRSLILVYADREAEIRGESVVGGVTVHHKVDLPGAGFYWIGFRTGESGNAESVLLTGVDQPALVIGAR